MPNRPTIDDVAQRAGVSIATVSRVVNGTTAVSPELDARVRAAIAELEYEPSLAARSLRRQQTNVIGILVADIEPFSAEVLKGVADALRETAYELVVYSGGRGGDRVGWEQAYLSRLNGTLADGTIIVTPTVADISSQHPVVAVDPHRGGMGIPFVASHNYEGAYAATQHLIDLGHRRIGFLGGRQDLESARLRDAGYRAALRDAKIRVDPALVVDGGFRRETAHEPVLRLLRSRRRPTAIFAGNDLSAIEALEVATGLGIDVPGELSIVGFDNVPESALTEPPLTTVDQSIRQLGATAARVLVDLIEHPEQAASVPTATLLPMTLVVRRSTAPPGS